MTHTETRWQRVADAAALDQETRRRIVRAACDAIEARGAFTLVLSGGDAPEGAYRLLRDAQAEWCKWHIYFGDERCVEPDSPARNSAMARREWLDHVPIPADQIHVMRAENGPRYGAIDYAEVLRDVDDFDFVLLGLGANGHTASLFPGHDAGTCVGARDTLAIFDASAPPPRRVSMSARRLSRAREVLFQVIGESRREAVHAWRGGHRIPAAMIAPANGVDVLVESRLLD